MPWCARPVPLIALPRAVGTVMLGVALACVIRFVPTPTAFGVAIGATARAAGGVRSDRRGWRCGGTIGMRDRLVRRKSYSDRIAHDWSRDRGLPARDAAERCCRERISASPSVRDHRPGAAADAARRSRCARQYACRRDRILRPWVGENWRRARSAPPLCHGRLCCRDLPWLPPLCPPAPPDDRISHCASSAKATCGAVAKATANKQRANFRHAAFAIDD